MTTTMPAEVLRGAYRVYGVDVVPVVGEDEITLVMPGHVLPLRAIAAAQRAHLSLVGERLCQDDRTLAEALELTRWTWAVLHDPATCTECEPDLSPEDRCMACTWVRVERDWWLSWGQTESTPGAFPVTVVEATS